MSIPPPEARPYNCLCCSRVLDLQGVQRGSRIVLDLWCHGCGAHITLRIKP